MLPSAPQPVEEEGRRVSTQRSRKGQTPSVLGLSPRKAAGLRMAGGLPAKDRNRSRYEAGEAGTRQTNGGWGSDQGPERCLRGCWQLAKKLTEALNVDGAHKACGSREAALPWLLGLRLLLTLNLLAPAAVHSSNEDEATE